MNLEQLRNTEYIILEAIVGSQLYGLATETSDTDTKGIFKLPNRELLKMSHPKQINDETNDTVFYEIQRFLELAMSANPNVLELLYLPDDKILQYTDIYLILRDHRAMFLTKAIKNSIGGYAIGQIKKARGKNKKIVNPIDKKRKDLLDFTYVLTPLGTVPIKDWLKRQRLTQNSQASYGASNIPNAHNMYYIYHNHGKYEFKGLIGEDSNELRLSSIPKEVIADYTPIYCNTEAYSTYCKDYKEYWEWVEKRNPARYESVKKHGKGYDGKNLMHCFRLLEMGIEAAKTGELQVERPNKEWLLKVRTGEFEYDELLALAETKLKEFEDAVDASSLPDKIDAAEIDKILLQLRYV